MEVLISGQSVVVKPTVQGGSQQAPEDVVLTCGGQWWVMAEVPLAPCLAGRLPWLPVVMGASGEGRRLYKCW